jgi:hypothetical protein
MAAAGGAGAAPLKEPRPVAKSAGSRRPPRLLRSPTSKVSARDRIAFSLGLVAAVTRLDPKISTTGSATSGSNGAKHGEPLGGLRAGDAQGASKGFRVLTPKVEKSLTFRVTTTR